MRSASTKAVNLAAKPFLNRRPVIRVAALVWLLAIGLSALNIWRYGDFFGTASNHRNRLATLESEIQNEEARHLELRKRVEALKLDEDNSTATFLNGLIHQRVFPWSRLFDDMENVLPKDVYLTGLAPQIEKVEKIKVRPRPRQGSRASRVAAKAAPKAPPKDIDRVSMSIEGYSRTDDAMLELVDRLYASPTFLDPVLSSEKREQRTGLVHFSIDVVYLTRAQQPATQSAEALAAAAIGAGETEGSTAGALAGDGATLAATVNGATGGAGTVTGVPGPQGEVGSGAAAGAIQPGVQPGAAAGRPASRPGFGFGAGAGGPADPAAPVVIQPGFRPDLRGGGIAGANGGTTTGPGGAQGVPGGAQGVPGGVVVPPRRPPTGLNPVPSATPGLRGGG